MAENTDKGKQQKKVVVSCQSQPVKTFVNKTLFLLRLYEKADSKDKHVLLRASNL